MRASKIFFQKAWERIWFMVPLKPWSLQSSKKIFPIKSPGNSLSLSPLGSKLNLNRCSLGNPSHMGIIGGVTRLQRQWADWSQAGDKSTDSGKLKGTCDVGSLFPSNAHAKGDSIFIYIHKYFSFLSKGWILESSSALNFCPPVINFYLFLTVPGYQWPWKSNCFYGNSPKF